MARPGVTYTEVENAAKRLQAEGRQPTIDAIRQMIGSGSDTTIMRHLKAWKERHSLELQAGNLPLPLIETIQGLWNRLKHEANSEIAIYEAEAITKIDEMQELVHRAQQQEATQRNENAAIQASLGQAQAKIEELSALLQAGNTENIRLKEYSDGFERQCVQQTEEIARLHHIIKQTQDNLEHYQAANLKLKETHSFERENERNAYLQDIRALESQISALSQRKAVLEHTLEHANKTLSDADGTILQLEAACQSLKNVALENKIKIALLEEKNQTLAHQTNKQEEQLKESTEKLCSALNQISAVTNKQEVLEVDLLKAQDKVQMLMDEKMFLVQEKTELLGQIKTLSA